MTDTHAPDAPDLTRLAEIARGTLVERMGITITHWTADRTVATMPVAGNTQPAGLLHGGASAALAETAASYAAMAHAGEGRGVVGLDLNATHHRAARSGTVTAVATAIHRGRTLVAYQIEITDDEGRRICTARLTCMILDERPAG